MDSQKPNELLGPQTNSMPQNELENPPLLPAWFASKQASHDFGRTSTTSSNPADFYFNPPRGPKQIGDGAFSESSTERTIAGNNLEGYSSNKNEEINKTDSFPIANWEETTWSTASTESRGSPAAVNRDFTTNNWLLSPVVYFKTLHSAEFEQFSESSSLSEYSNFGIRDFNSTNYEKDFDTMLGIGIETVDTVYYNVVDDNINTASHHQFEANSAEQYLYLNPEGDITRTPRGRKPYRESRKQKRFLEKENVNVNTRAETCICKECEKKRKTQHLRNEISMLSENYIRLVKECEKLAIENDAMTKQLKHWEGIREELERMKPVCNSE